MKLKQLFLKVEDSLKQVQVAEPHRTVVWIFCDVLGCDPSYLIAQEDLLLDGEQIDQILRAAARCASYEPVQYVTRHTEFRGLYIHVSPDVLIPRPETEQLVDVALESVRAGSEFRVLDIGTGSGCIALAVKQMLPHAEVTACDVSHAALAVAKKNAAHHEFCIQFIQADLLAGDFVDRVGTGYDLILANPPYIPDHERQSLPRMVRAYEPHVALFCGQDPLRFYRAVLDHLTRGLLHPTGVLALETHSDSADAVAALLNQTEPWQAHVQKDFGGLPRFILAASQRKILSPCEYTGTQLDLNE